MIVKTGKILLRGIYALMKLRPIRNRVTILSRQSDVPTADITLLADYLREKHGDVSVVTMCRTLEGSSGIGYCFHMLGQMWQMAVSKVIVIDGYCIAVCLLDHRKGTEVVQMWHASAAIKKFGYQTLDMPGGHSKELAELMHMHRNYDHVLCPSEMTGRIFCEAFRTDSSRLKLMALPRIDLILDPRDRREKLRNEYGIDDDREVLLYAPTFRKSSELVIRDMVSAIDDRFVLVICPHPLDRSRSLFDDGILSKGNVIVDHSSGTYDWMAACDRIITDYSAVAAEATISGKPLYFYVYDIDDYLKDEGLNFDPREEVPEITAEDPDTLAKILEKDYPGDVLEGLGRKFFEVETDACTARLGEYIYGLAEKKD